MIIDAHKIKFQDQIFTKTAEAMRAIAEPLKKYRIEHFSYQICHGNNVFEILTTHPTFSQLFIDKRFYKHALAGNPKDYADGFILSDDLGRSEVLQALSESEGITHGVIIVRTTLLKTELFYFGSTEKNKNTNTFFINNMHVLNQFIKYFQINSVDILKKSSEQKLFYPGSNDATILTSQEWRQKNFPLDIVLKTKTSFTARELETITLLKIGLSYKEIALEIGVSYRTVEKFIEAVKQKVGCRTISQLLSFLFKLDQSQEVIF